MFTQAEIDMISEIYSGAAQQIRYRTNITAVVANPKNLDISYRWRFKSNVVANITLVIASFGYVLVGALAIVYTYVTLQMKRGVLNQEIQDMIPGLEPDTENVYMLVGLLLVLMAAGLNSLEYYSADGLQEATSTLRDPEEILQACVLWKNINLLLLVLTATPLVRWYTNVFLWIFVVYRAIFLMIVGMHIRELRKEKAKLGAGKQKYAAIQTSDDNNSISEKLA